MTETETDKADEKFIESRTRKLIETICSETFVARRRTRQCPRFAQARSQRTGQMVCVKHWIEQQHDTPWTLGQMVGDALRAVSVHGQPVVS